MVLATYHLADVFWPSVSGPVTAPELWPQHLLDRSPWRLHPFSSAGSCLNAGTRVSLQGRSLIRLQFPLVSALHLYPVSSGVSSVSSLLLRAPDPSTEPLSHLCALAWRTALYALNIGTGPGTAVSLLFQIGTELWHENHFTLGGSLLPPGGSEALDGTQNFLCPWLQLSPEAPPTKPGQVPFPTATTPSSTGNRTCHLW